MSGPSIDECIEFLRKHNILKDWNIQQIKAGIITAIKTCCLTFSTDSHGKLDGLVFGRWIIPNEHIFIIAVAGKGKLKYFFRFLQSHFPDCHKISAKRNGIEKIYSI